MRAARLDAHTQLCRICDQLKPACEFTRGSSYCRPCEALRQQQGAGAGAAEAARLVAAGKLEKFTRLSEAQRRAAITKHAVGLDLAIMALFQEGGFGAVHIGVAEAMKRLADRRRPEITAEGWIV